MSFDLASIVGSAAVGGLVSLAVASWRIGQEERAKRRLAAKEKGKNTVSALIKQVVRYEANRADSREEESNWWHHDWIWASSILAAARTLGRRRSWLVRLQVRPLVGQYILELAETEPCGNVLEGQALTNRWNISPPTDQVYGPRTITHALRTSPGSPELASLRRRLKWLSRSWW